jgi:hypothetical protein
VGDYAGYSLFPVPVAHGGERAAQGLVAKLFVKGMSAQAFKEKESRSVAGLKPGSL